MTFFETRTRGIGKVWESKNPPINKVGEHDWGIRFWELYPFFGQNGALELQLKKRELLFALQMSTKCTS